MHQWNQRENMFLHLRAKIPYITMIQSYFSNRDEFLWPNAFSNWFLSRRYELRFQNIATQERSIMPFSITKQLGPRSFNLIFIESFPSAVRGKDILTAPALFSFLVSNSFFPPFVWCCLFASSNLSRWDKSQKFNLKIISLAGKTDKVSPQLAVLPSSLIV